MKVTKLVLLAIPTLLLVGCGLGNKESTPKTEQASKSTMETVISEEQYPYYICEQLVEFQYWKDLLIFNADKESGQFLQLKPSSDGSFVPFPSLDSSKTGRKEDKQKFAQRSMLSIELQTSNGTMMRIQGDMSPEHLAAISYAS